MRSSSKCENVCVCVCCALQNHLIVNYNENRLSITSDLQAIRNDFTVTPSEAGRTMQTNDFFHVCGWNERTNDWRSLWFSTTEDNLFIANVRWSFIGNFQIPTKLPQFPLHYIDSVNWQWISLLFFFFGCAPEINRPAHSNTIKSVYWLQQLKIEENVLITANLTQTHLYSSRLLSFSISIYFIAENCNNTVEPLKLFKL